MVLNGMLSDAPNAELHRKLRHLATLNQAEMALPLAERHGNTLLLAASDWPYKRLAKYHLKKPPKSTVGEHF